MGIRAFAFALLLLVPRVSALDYSDQSLMYLDAPFRSADAAGISLLTNIGAVQGNPDGTFQPDRTLNRAEFLKIALASHPKILVLKSDAERCFLDIARDAWFSPYVCIAKKRGIVGGYPDGTFGPGNSVNYAEALKILGEMYDVQIPWDELPPADLRWRQTHWYVPYREGAITAGVSLESSLDGSMDHWLTRGQMARLAAAYRAHHDGQLTEYRRVERGESLMQPQSSAARSAISSLSSASSSSSTPPLSRWTHPATSHFLIVGQQSDPIASGLFQFSEPQDIRSVTVEMKRELKAIHALVLVDHKGRALATLAIDKTDATRRRWRGDNAAGVATVGPGSVPLGIAAVIKTPLQGGFPEEFIEAKNISMMVGDPSGISTEQALPVEWSHPPHQTSLTFIASVRNAGPARGTLLIGNDQRVAEFRFAAGSGTPIHIEQLTLTASIGPEISVSHWRVARVEGGPSVSCSVGSDGLLTCPLTEEIGVISGGSTTLVVIADIAKVPGKDGGTLQVILDAPGSTSSFGAVQWSDGTGHYRWIEGEAPLAEGTRWAG